MLLTGNFELELERARDERGADLSLSEAIAKRLDGLLDWIPETKGQTVEAIVIHENGADAASGTWTGAHGATKLSGTWKLRWITRGVAGYLDLETSAYKTQTAPVPVPGNTEEHTDCGSGLLPVRWCRNKPVPNVFRARQAPSTTQRCRKGRLAD